MGPNTYYIYTYAHTYKRTKLKRTYYGSCWSKKLKTEKQKSASKEGKAKSNGTHAPLDFFAFVNGFLSLKLFVVVFEDQVRIYQ